MSGSAPQVSLRELTAETFRAVCRLDVAEHQRGFVAPNAVSMAEAGFYQEAWFRGIYAGEEPVGFVMLADDTLKGTPPAEPTAFIWRFMIDARHQGQGFGRAALELVIEHVRAKGFPYLQLSYVEGPGCPEPFYLRAGFEHTGKLEEGEKVLELRFDGKPVERVGGDAAGAASDP